MIACPLIVNSQRRIIIRGTDIPSHLYLQTTNLVHQGQVHVALGLPRQRLRLIPEWFYDC